MPSTLEQSQARRIEYLEGKLMKYAVSIKINIKARGGWWWIHKRPYGKDSVKKAGNYIRDPFNN